MRNNNTRKIDAIVVLGGGITADGILSPATRERLDYLLKKGKTLLQAPIILSGRWSGFAKAKPHTTEAQEMKRHLTRHGIGARQIILESESLDTISNAVFVRRIVDRRRYWKKILLITSNWHMKRAVWIFRRIFGKNYQIIPLSAMSGKEVKEQRKGYENYLLVVAQRFLRDIPAGSKELIELLRAEHPFYSKSEKAQKLLRDVVSRKKKISA